MAKREYRNFQWYLPDPDNPTGEWIGVLHGFPDDLPFPFELCPRYSTEHGELQCAGLRIGWGADYRPRTNITSRMLARLPLGAVLRFLQEHEDSPEELPEGIRARLKTAYPLELMLPPEGRSAVAGARRKDDFYIRQAELFAEIYAQRRRTRARGSVDVYKRLAERTGWAEATVRVQVRKGWDLRPGLKPEGVRTRQLKPKEEK